MQPTWLVALWFTYVLGEQHKDLMHVEWKSQDATGKTSQVLQGLRKNNRKQHIKFQTTTAQAGLWFQLSHFLKNVSLSFGQLMKVTSQVFSVIMNDDKTVWCLLQRERGKPRQAKSLSKSANLKENCKDFFFSTWWMEDRCAKCPDVIKLRFPKFNERRAKTSLPSRNITKNCHLCGTTSM